MRRSSWMKPELRVDLGVDASPELHLRLELRGARKQTLLRVRGDDTEEDAGECGKDSGGGAARSVHDFPLLPQPRGTSVPRSVIQPDYVHRATAAVPDPVHARETSARGPRIDAGSAAFLFCFYRLTRRKYRSARTTSNPPVSAQGQHDVGAEAGPRARAAPCHARRWASAGRSTPGIASQRYSVAPTGISPIEKSAPATKSCVAR